MDGPYLFNDFFPVVVQLLSPALLFAAPWIAARQAPLSFTISQSLLKFMSIELVMPSNHLILCRPLPLLPSISPSFRVFSDELALYTSWPKSWSFSFSISSFSENSVLISIMIDWFDLLAVQVPSLFDDKYFCWILKSFRLRTILKIAFVY